MERKQQIRDSALHKRSAIDVLDWQKHTEVITKTVTEHDWFREATDIYCYVDCKGEVGTRAIIEEAWRLGKTVWVPKVISSEIIFYKIDSFSQLEKGCFGVMEPQNGEVADGLEGLVIVPGVAFDKNCGRLGYGKGYYDRYLLAHPGLHTIAVAFDIQVEEDIPVEEQDIRPDVLITETMMKVKGQIEE